MKITEIQNIKFIQIGNIISVQPPNRDGLIISGFEVDFKKDFPDFELDYCACIALSVIKERGKLLFTAVTQKREIDEFITISLKYKTKSKHYKLRFIRL